MNVCRHGLRWLKKALQQVQEGDLVAADVYNILKAAERH